MALTVQDVEPADLPGDATKGFKILGDQGETALFFHWHDDPTDYAEVLTALPARLEEMDYEPDVVGPIVNEIVGRYGAGA